MASAYREAPSRRNRRNVPWTLGSPPLPTKQTVVVRPREITDVLVNPGMGFQTFQRSRNQALSPGLTGQTWSEAGPVKVEPDIGPLAVKFPDTSVAYCRWHYGQWTSRWALFGWLF